MWKLKRNSLAFQIWKYLMLFSVIILSFLWLFQVVLLDRYYEWSKIQESKKIASLLKNENLSQEEVEKISYEQDVCIELVSSQYALYQVGNCYIPTTNVKARFLSNEEKEKITIFKNSRFKNKVLIYGKKLGIDTYMFLSTSLEPLNKTANILAHQLFYVTIGVFLFSFLIAYFISKHISNPIVKISKISKKIANGAFHTSFETEEDLDELNELVSSLNEMKEELAKTEELRRDLMANVSHDLKTPLTLIKAYAEMVRDLHYKNKEKREQSLNTIIEEVDRLTILVNDILALSKEEANVETLTVEEFDLVAMMNTILTRYDILKQQEGYCFTFQHPKQALIQADKKKLEQVIYNLINNAINYTGKDKKIMIHVLENSNQYRVEIKDTGKGIKEEELAHIWDKYYKNKKNHQRNYYGTGLGLAIVKNILEHHHFRYGVESKKNKGSTFYFEIPITKRKNT